MTCRNTQFSCFFPVNNYLHRRLVFVYINFNFINTRNISAIDICTHFFGSCNQFVIIISFQFNIDWSSSWWSISIFFHRNQNSRVNSCQCFLHFLTQFLTIQTSSIFVLTHRSCNFSFVRHFSSRTFICLWISCTFTHLRNRTFYHKINTFIHVQILI